MAFKKKANIWIRPLGLPNSVMKLDGLLLQYTRSTAGDICSSASSAISVTGALRTGKAFKWTKLRWDAQLLATGSKDFSVTLTAQATREETLSSLEVMSGVGRGIVTGSVDKMISDHASNGAFEVSTTTTILCDVKLSLASSV